jgi:hypothetical protein
MRLSAAPAPTGAGQALDAVAGLLLFQQAAGGQPDGVRIDAFGVALEHLGEELCAGGLCGQEPGRVIEVLAGFGDVAGRVVAGTVFVPGDHVCGAERFDDVKRAVPAVQACTGCFGEILVDVVVDDVAGGDQADGGCVQDGGVVGIAVPGLDRNDGVPVDGESAVGGRLGQDWNQCGRSPFGSGSAAAGSSPEIRTSYRSSVLAGIAAAYFR